MSQIITLSEPLVPQSALLKRFGQEFPHLKRVSTQRIAYVQVSQELSEDQKNALHGLLLNGKGSKAGSLPDRLDSPLPRGDATASALVAERSEGRPPSAEHPHPHLFEIAFQPAIMDPERIAIDKMLGTLDFQQFVEEVKLSTVYAFEGLSEEEASTLVHKYLFNKLLHVIIPHDHAPDTLTIRSEAEPMQIIEGFREMNLRQLKELSEARSLYMEDDFLLETQRKFRDDLKRDPTDAEIEYVAQRTSDHCFHTTWKSLGLFKKLKSEVDKVLPSRPDIISVFVDNSGVMSTDLPSEAGGDGVVSPFKGSGVRRGSEGASDVRTTTYMIKGETHNSPTAIAPVGGVETMHGGCLRDIMGTGQGGYPTMATQVFIVGDQTKEEMAEKYEVDQFLDPLVILRGMVQGVQNYGNPMGIPNFGGRVMMHPQFFGKPLALGIALGLGEKKYSKKGTPLPGDIALLVGNPTGRDGIHGATMSSAANSEQMVKKEGAAVQIGDPYTERLIMEATPELRPLLRVYGDMGAGGIASCFGEMGEGVGLEIDLKDIPTKYDGLAPWEKLESESQERMGMAVPPDNLEAVKKILDHHEIPYHVLGEFTDKQRFVVKHGADTIVDLDYDWLEHFPIPQKKVDQYIPQTIAMRLPESESVETQDLASLRIRDQRIRDQRIRDQRIRDQRIRDQRIRDRLLSILWNPDLADQSLFFRRWDSTVQGKTLRESCAPFTNMPFDQGITVPEPDKKYTQVLSLTINPWWSASPYKMGQATFAGTVSKQISAGVKRNKIAMCDNFYTPKARPEIDAHLTEMVRAITDMMVDLGTPMISGKDSSSGTTKMIKKTGVGESSPPEKGAGGSEGTVESFEISPTICMSAMGMGEDAMKVPPKALQKAGNKLFFVPAGISNDASGSVLLPAHERQASFNYEIDIQEYTKTVDRIAELIDDGKIRSISVVDDGGIFHRVFEMMLGSGLGVEISNGVARRQNGEDIDPRLQDGILEFLTNALPGSFVVEVSSEAELEGLDAIPFGEITEDPELRIGSDVLTLDEMRSAWEQTWYDLLQLPYEQKPIDPPKDPLPFVPSKVTKKKVNVVYSPGINCHQEMVRAWQMLGTDVSLISVTDRHAKFADADIVVFPGGFADGDYLGAAKVWHRIMETQFKDQMDYLRTGKIPVLGICNGFQMMTRSGFFGNNLRLTFNENAQFEQRWSRLKFTEASANSIWTKGLEGKEITVPIAHGEGRFIVDGKMETATLSLQYHPDEYPNNPNGSMMGIAGVFSGDKGQFWGGMPHPERAIEEYHFTRHGLLFFENILKNI